MSELIKRKASVRYAIIIGAAFLLAALMAGADGSIANELQRCSSIEDTSARLACYDGLSGPQSVAPIAPSAAVDSLPVELSAVEASGAEQSADEPLADPSPETVRGDTDDKYETVTIQGTIKKCRQDANKKYYFYFENGQVWKQSDRKRLNFKECDFNVTITKDFFGSKMQQEGEDRRIRITRVK